MAEQTPKEEHASEEAASSAAGPPLVAQPPFPAAILDRRPQTLFLPHVHDALVAVEEGKVSLGLPKLPWQDGWAAEVFGARPMPWECKSPPLPVSGPPCLLSILRTLRCRHRSHILGLNAPDV